MSFALIHGWQRNDLTLSTCSDQRNRIGDQLTGEGRHGTARQYDVDWWFFVVMRFDVESFQTLDQRNEWIRSERIIGITS